MGAKGIRIELGKAKKVVRSGKYRIYLKRLFIGQRVRNTFVIKSDVTPHDVFKIDINSAENLAFTLLSALDEMEENEEWEEQEDWLCV